MNDNRAALPARTWRSIIGEIHLWIGLILCVPLVLLGLSGTILTFEEELGGGLYAMPGHKAVEGTARPAAEIVAAAQKAAPQGFAPTLYVPASEPGDFASVRLAPQGRGGPAQFVRVLVDPVSLAATREASDTGFLRLMHSMHGNAMLDRDIGRPWIIGTLGIAMLALGISGIVNWWPRPGRIRAAFSIRTNVSTRQFHRELHGAVGIWALIVFIIVSASGTYLAYPQTVGAVVKLFSPVQDLRAIGNIRVEPQKGERIGLDQALTLAQSAAPDAKLNSVFLPVRGDQPLRVNLLPPGQERGTPMVSVIVDPWSQRVVKIFDPRAYTAGEKLLGWQHAIHAGEGFGLVWKILVGLSGLLPLLFVVTGISFWWLGRRDRMLQTQRPESAPVFSARRAGE